MHDRKSLSSIQAYTAARPSTLFAVDHYVPTPSPSSKLHTLVVIAGKRRLFVHEYAEKEHVKEHIMAAQPRAITICAPDAVFLTYAKAHVRLDIKTGVSMELSELQQSLSTNALTTSLSSSPIRVVGGLSTGMANVFSGLYGSGVDGRPNSVRLPGNECLLGRESILFFAKKRRWDICGL